MKMKKIISIIYNLLFLVLILYIVAVKCYPEQTNKLLGYRLYSVLTDSMNPVIPTNSLILIKQFDESQPLKEDTIMSFHANRFGRDIIITHYFKGMERNAQGDLCYRTQAYNSTSLDAYETKQSDIIGTYVGHIPYIGKLFLFLQSYYGLWMVAMLSVIMLLYQYASSHFDGDEEVHFSFTFHH